jgi:hypothetical protein
MAGDDNREYGDGQRNPDGQRNDGALRLTLVVT